MSGGIRVALTGHRAAGESTVVVSCGDGGHTARGGAEHDGVMTGHAPCAQQRAERTDQQERVERGVTGNGGAEHERTQQDREQKDRAQQDRAQHQ